MDSTNSARSVSPEAAPPRATTPGPTPQHVCGLMGYNPMLGDPPCPGCEYAEEVRLRATLASSPSGAGTDIGALLDALQRRTGERVLAEAAKVMESYYNAIPPDPSPDHQRREADARAAVEREFAAEAERKEERLALAEMILGNFRAAPCLRELLGEDSDGCECMGCASRAYFVALAPACGDGETP